MRTVGFVGAVLLASLAPAYGPAGAAYMTGEYWPLPSGEYRYSMTVWNQPPEGNYYVWTVITGAPADAHDPAQPNGWYRLPGKVGRWETDEIQYMVGPGDFLGRFAYTSPTLDPGVEGYLMLGLNPDDPHDVDRWRYYFEWELVPEPTGVAALGAPALLLLALARRRKR
jgi:hypothetical protein